MSFRSPTTRRAFLGALTAVVTFVTIGAAHAGPVLDGGHGATGLHRVWVHRGHYRIAAYVQAGAGPAIVLCHGFPDNHHLYDLVLPYLKGRHVVSFDFLGWGASDKPAAHKYTFAGQEADLNAVISQLHLGSVILVGHDASGPTVLNWALDHPGRVHSIVLGNTFYGPVPEAGPPALTSILTMGQYPVNAPLGSLPAGFAHGLESLVDELGRNPVLFRALFDWDERTFFRSAKVAAAFIPLFRDQFLTRPSSYGPLRSLAADTFAIGAADAGRLTRLAGLGRFTHIVWGAQDPYINLHMARALHSELVGSTLRILRGAHHNLMLDDPAAFASAILAP